MACIYKNCHVTLNLEVENSFIRFNVKNKQIISDSKNACWLTYPKYETVMF